MARFINGLGGLALVLTSLVVEEKIVIDETMGASTHILHKRITEVFGDRTKLAELSQWTQDERTALGFSPNDPLLRNGKLLRDHVEREHLGNVGRVGSDEIVQYYSEMGYVNARTGTSVPPRPTFRIGLAESKEEIVTAFTDALGFLFLGTGTAALRRWRDGHVPGLMP